MCVVHSEFLCEVDCDVCVCKVVCVHVRMCTLEYACGELGLSVGGVCSGMCEDVGHGVSV